MISIKKTIFISIPMLFVLAAGHSQQGSTGAEADFIDIYNITREKYGDNPLLLNGIYYENPYYTAKGHPFILNGEFQSGAITFGNKNYEGVQLKYDLFHQQIVLDHAHNGIRVQNLPAIEFIDGFRINELNFMKLAIGGQVAFYQVIADGKDMKCLYAWYKVRNEEHAIGTMKTYVFSESKQKKYLLLGAELSRYRNNRSFIGALPEEAKGPVREYLKENHLNVATADDYAMNALIGFCQEKISRNFH